MSNNIRTQIGKVIGQTLNTYHSKVKPTIDDLKFRQEYQDRIIECMVGEVDDNYIETPETNEPIVKLEHSREGLIKVPSIKGKTILVDAEGNETDTPAEGCRLVSVGEDEDNKLIILSKNKNLFDGKLERGWIDGEGNEMDMDRSRTKFIRVCPNIPYILSSSNRFQFRISFYDINKNYISSYSSMADKNGMKITTLSNCYYIRFMFATTLTEGVTWDIQLELGNIVSSYIEPKCHKTEILLDEPLRKLPNGVCDEIVGDKIIRRIGVFKFDITKRFGNSGLLPQDKTTIFQGDFALDTKSESHVYTEKLNVINLYNDTEGLVETLGGTGGLRVYFRISKDRGFDTPQKFEKYLYDLDPTILYELAEPIIEELPNGMALQGFDDTTMYIENSITPTVSYGYNALIPYKEELSNQKEEVEVNTLDIENNIIPYLMDMEFNLMLMEDK